MLTLKRYHLYFDPEKQQIYQLTQMMATMAIDLEIHKPLRGDQREYIHQISPFLGCDTTPESTGDLEIKRTLLGCYYISSS
jgi:hypothetical protein